MSHWISLVRKASQSQIAAVKHYGGLPASLGSGEPQVSLPLPDFLVIEETKEGFYLFRYTKAGDFGGDTWHQSLQDAKDQATFEFKDSLTNWREVPSHIEDLVAYGAELL